jgi:hypothetical protein
MLSHMPVSRISQVAEGLYPNHPLSFNYMNIQVRLLLSVWGKALDSSAMAAVVESQAQALSWHHSRPCRHLARMHRPSRECDATRHLIMVLSPPPCETSGAGLPRGGPCGALSALL